MFSRTESFSQYIRLYPVVTFFLALNILIYLVTLIPVYRATSIILWHRSQLSYFRWGMVETSNTDVLHGGIMHLLFNMFSLFIFGPELEKIAGKARFLTIYLLSGIFANIATFFLQAPDYRSLGASGASFRDSRSIRSTCLLHEAYLAATKTNYFANYCYQCSYDLYPAQH